MNEANHRTETPRGDLRGLGKYLRYDLLSGFLVFLIALPLCLGIASACGYPPIAGIFTAIVGSVVATIVSNSELTIKGPAAGLIVIAIGCIQEFGGNGIGGGWSDIDQQAYRMALGVGVAAGLLQIVFGLLRTGILGEFFPTSAVHGMLAAIGVIIIAKQVPIALGVGNKGEPLHLLLSIPEKFQHMNPEIALIGAISLLILFGFPLIRNRYVRMIPAPMAVVLVAVPLGIYFDLTHEHTYSFGGHSHHMGEEYLVPVPDNMFNAITLPDFSCLSEARAWKWVLMFALIGSLESLLSAKAIDNIDPWRRRTNFDRDLLAVGIGNTIASAIGGLPMISEIVRSKANIDNGARTRFADLFHGLFLLLFVASVPWLIHRIPLAALGAMLVYTGFRLASPREFFNVYRVGREQLLIFTSTVIAVLATDLLIGIGIGIAVEVLTHLLNGAPIWSLFRPQIVEELNGRTRVIKVKQSAVFSSWISLRRRLMALAHDTETTSDVVLDLSETKLVDHTVMEKLHEVQEEYERLHRTLIITGLEGHRKLSAHPHATRVRTPFSFQNQQVLVGLTLTARDADLIRYVARLANLGIIKKVTFAHVGAEQNGRANGEMSASRRAVLAAAVAEHFVGVPAGVEVREAIVTGPVLDGLLELAAEFQADTILIGLATQLGRRALARRLAMKAPCCVWIVPEGAALDPRKLLVPVDFSDNALLAMRAAAALTCSAEGATCMPVHIFFDEATTTYEGRARELHQTAQKEYEQFLTRLNCSELALQPIFEEAANVIGAVHAIAEKHGADLIVMAPRGLSRSAEVLLGSVTEGTLIETRTPILIVKYRSGSSGLSKTFMRTFFSTAKEPQVH
ncbi:MAG: universal stress protein [Gemmataceae bacterium]|nr:universal stress protein [Gemmataceae bacterium]